MTLIASLPLAQVARSTAVPGENERQGSKVLVAYFSRTGNTRVVAGLIHRALNADLFEICPQQPYPKDYLETVEQARKERDSDFEPPLASLVPEWGTYTTVFLGFPIWGESTPPVIRSFLSKHEFSGKTLVPFVTHGGYGLGNSRAILARHISNDVRLLEGFSMQADQERTTMELVRDWLNERET